MGDASECRKVVAVFEEDDLGAIERDSLFMMMSWSIKVMQLEVVMCVQNIRNG